MILFISATAHKADLYTPPAALRPRPRGPVGTAVEWKARRGQHRSLDPRPLRRSPGRATPLRAAAPYTHSPPPENLPPNLLAQPRRETVDLLWSTYITCECHTFVFVHTQDTAPVSHQLTEVKLLQALVVLWWGTTWEGKVMITT